MTIGHIPVTILRCPVSRQGLRLMSDSELAGLNARIQERKVSHRDGTEVAGALQAGLTTPDGAFAYRIHESIVELLAHRAIALAGERAEGDGSTGLSSEKEVVRRFYDEFGWQQTDDGLYLDTVTYGDLRPVSEHALDASHSRVKRYLTGQGRYLLDVASGPVLPPYLEYGDRFDYRLCIDLSVTALQQASRRLGPRGTYVLGDITNLPLVDDAVDGLVSLHTIYHVPEEEQAVAFRELYRVLAPGRSGVVVYRWAPTRWADMPPRWRALVAPWRLLRRVRRVLSASRPASRAPTNASSPPPQYFHAHTHRWFIEQAWPFRPKIVSWSAVSTEFRQRYVREGLTGRMIMGALQLFEERLPRLAGRLGMYPLIVLEKPPRPVRQTAPEAAPREPARA